jgi:hypothetical protein
MLDSGRLVCAGATGAPAPDGALFIFKNIGPDEIEAFVQVCAVCRLCGSLFCLLGAAVGWWWWHGDPSPNTHHHRHPPNPTTIIKADPYVKAGLVTSHKVSPYGVVVGAP